ncbi:hypothetical protein JL722_10069 [Aureococcus anophagefferens]|nr:hypothetical protein JL722_10069 [Aureococcus anophagefferens]
MALVVANETYLADLILPFVDVFQMGRVEMMSRAGRGACEIIALRLREPRPGRAGCGPTVVRDDEPQSHAYLCLCLLSRREAVRRGPALAAGPLHSVVADKRGRVWSFGHGAHGRLGLGGSWLSACTPRPVELPSRVRVAQVAAAHRHSVALDVLGRAYTWGSDEFDAQAPTLLWRLADDAVIVKVAACGAHSLALDAEGRVFSWGDGDGGRLGHGDDAGKAEPTLISALAGTRATHVGCGAECSCVVTEAPELFWFGAENGLSYVTDFVEAETDGLLCWRLPTACPRALPDAPRRRRRASSASSYRSSLGSLDALDDDGDESGGDGDGDAAPLASRPTRFALCRDGTGAFSRRRLALPAPAVAAACSDEHYLVLTDDGDVHSAGNGGHGRLGHGSHTSNQDPKRIDALNRDG